MNRTEATQLLRAVRAGCAGQAIDEYTPDLWAMVLADYSYADAMHVLVDLLRQPLEPGKSRYVEPGHIIGGIHRLRRQRLADAPPVDPPSGLDQVAYRAWLTRQRAAVAAGRTPETCPPAPTTQRDRIAALVRSLAKQMDA